MVVVSCFHYDTLQQNATDIITKLDNHFITKCDKSLTQNASSFLLQNATVLLQNALVITKCGSYYKVRRLLQNTSVHSLILTFFLILLLFFNTYFFLRSDQ